MAQIIPELALYDLIEKMTTYLSSDLAGAVSDEETLLYSILGDNEYKGSLYFDKAKKIFLRAKENPRKIRFQLYYTYEIEEIPTISISAPVDQPASGADSLGGGENSYLDKVLSPEETNPFFTRNFQSTINIIVTSKNVEEQVILYNVYRALLVGFLPVLDLMGFRNPSLSGRDMQVDPELINSNAYVRIISISYFYEVSVPQKKIREMISTLNWNPEIKNPE